MPENNFGFTKEYQAEVTTSSEEQVPPPSGKGLASELQVWPEPQMTTSSPRSKEGRPIKTKAESEFNTEGYITGKPKRVTIRGSVLHDQG